MSAQDRKRRRLFKLWEVQGKLCHWCKQPTVLIFRPNGDMKTIARRDDEATIDHLNTRYGERYQVKDGEEVLVMACNKCNNQRGQEKTASIPVEELRRRAGQPKPIVPMEKSTMAWSFTAEDWFKIAAGDSELLARIREITEKRVEQIRQGRARQIQEN